MSKPTDAPGVATHLSRRESEIMDVVYRLGEASVAEVMGYLKEPPGYNSVRVTLRILEEKGHVRHRKDGRRFLYAPTTPRDKAGRGALGHLVDTFYQGSATRAVATLVDMSAGELDDSELAELSRLIDAAREGKETR